MATKMQIQIIQREIVKPSSPTPDTCRTYKLSLLDQYCPSDSVPILMFYPATTHPLSIPETSDRLVKSLSKILTSFYQFAGRLRNNIFVECNDDGAEFAATSVNCSLSMILRAPDFGTLQELVPLQTFPKEEQFTSPFLTVQANFFDCGGLAIGVCLSHKVADVSTLSLFINGWAATASKSELEQELIPQFVSPESFFPPLESLVSYVGHDHQVHDAHEKVKIKRLIFDRPRIEALKSKAGTHPTVGNPTRVEVVSALIWKCLIEAVSVSNNSSFDTRSCSFTQSVNIRKRMKPCLPENAVGNLLGCFHATISRTSVSCKPELQDLVVLLREGINRFKAVYKTKSPWEALAEMSARGDDVRGHHFLASSWCRFPLYDTDFGWGKPAWICVPNVAQTKNVCAMLDTRDGEGIEVTLLLEEEDMKRFEQNPELLAFASLNPAVIV